MKNYKALYRFRAWAIGGTIAVVGIGLCIAGQVDSVGMLLLGLMILAVVVRGYFDGVTTDNRLEAECDYELSTARLIFLVVLCAVFGGGFLIYALTR